MSKSVYRAPSKRTRLPRVLFTCATALVLLVFIAAGLNLRSSAQNDESRKSDREASFNRKADRILRSVRRAVDEDRAAASKGQLRREASALNRLARIARIKESDNDIRVNVAVTLTDGSQSDLQAAGFQLQSRVGDVATLDVSVDQLPDLAALASVQKIFASVVRRPLNDRARQSARIDNSSGQRVVTQTGRGVVVGIIDTGIDFRHLDFTVPGSGGHQTRIKAMLDMTEYGAQSPDPGWNYSLPGQSAVIGHFYSEADINAALQLPKPASQGADLVKQRDKSGHGTHVAGTAAGNGQASPAAGTYSGMAPEADLIIVKASRQNDGTDDFDTTDLINALEFVRQKAAELGEPFVINLSIGGQVGPHDGTTPDERAIDNLVNGGSGRAVCVAAGNEGGASIHSRGTVPAGGSQTLDFNVNGDAYIVDLYQNNADRFSVTVTSPDGVALGPIAYDANGFGFPSGQGSNQYLQVFNANDDKGDSDAANDQPNIALLFKPAAPDGMWKIKLQDADGNANQSYDAWATGDGVYFSNFLDNDSHLVASPGTARGAITVGAFVTRSATQTIGAPASFTSPGPTADGRQKPDISAAGYYLYSSRSTDITDANFGTIGTGANAPTDSTHYTGLAGTSMATPVTTGSVALLLQAAPGLAIDTIKTLLTDNADHDTYDPPGWNSRFGQGKLNIADAINANAGIPKRLTISGRVNGLFGNSGAVITLSGSRSGSIVLTDSGDYTFSDLPAGGDYTLTPSSPNYTFIPASQTFNNLRFSQTFNFSATARRYNINGRVVDANGVGVGGVDIMLYIDGSSFSGLSTDAGGGYSFGGMTAGHTYTLTPYVATRTFSPSSKTFPSLSADQYFEFTINPLHTISGRITDGKGLPIDSAYVFISAPGSNVGVSLPTDSNGYYAYTGASEGSSYELRPTKSGYTFSPPSQIIDSLGTNREANFTGVYDPLIDNGFFVTQQYRDFLAREPDAYGLSYWSNEIYSCGPYSPSCTEAKRVNVSAAFFLSIEFQETGYLVERIYKSAYGDADALSALNTYPSTHPIKAPIVTFNEFMLDQQQIARDVRVGIGNWQGQLEYNKAAFTHEFVTRSRFVAAFPTTMTPAEFVDKLFTNAGVAPTADEHAAIIDEFGGAGNSADIESRARAFRRVAENAVLAKAETNRAFVLMQYFGYLRRDPNSGPDTDHTGYDFWLAKLNEHNGNYINAEMVKAFIVSIEYHKRFE